MGAMCENVRNGEMETIKLIEMVIFISRCVLSFPLSRIKPKSPF